MQSAAVPSREWTTHSSEETIQLGREIGRQLDAASSDFAFR